MDTELTKLYSSRILNPTEYMNFTTAYNMSAFYDELLKEFSSLLTNGETVNESIQTLIDKYTEQKTIYSRYIDSACQDFILSTGYHMSCVAKVTIVNEPPHVVEVYVKNISPNVKYNFKVVTDQFGYSVTENFYDIHEIEMINRFEEVCLKLVENEDKLVFSMIELGSNQAYYSLLFHKILLKYSKVPVNILVESNVDAIPRGIKHFEMNNCIGKFFNSIIGNMDTVKRLPHLLKLNEESGIKISTLTNIMLQENINYLDVLHCDIDYAEYDMLMTSKEVFQNKQIDYIFLATHGAELHQKCKQFLLDCGYNIIFEHDDMDNPIGWDTLIILKS